MQDERYNKILEGAAKDAAYYRANPHRFVKDYLHVDLRLFQKIVLFMMAFSTQFVFSACRGVGKSYMVAIYCIFKCILYPGTKVVVASGTRGQAIVVLQKIITELIPNSPELNAEIKEKKINGTEAIMHFWNGSYIEVVSANDNARSRRATILILDEFRIIKKDVVDTVLRKFLTQRRMPPYESLSREQKYAEYDKEKNGTYYLSSAYYKSSWAWDKCKDTLVSMVDDDKSQFIVGIPYQVPLMEGLISKETIEDELSESTLNPVQFSMEYESIWYGNSFGNFYQFGDLAKNRNIAMPFYPDNVSVKLSGNKQIHTPVKSGGEVRILSVDVALMSSKKNRNDAAAIVVNRMIPTKNHRYISNFVFCETHEGLRTEALALRVRQLFDEFNCDWLVVDTNGVGLSVYDCLSTEIVDHDTGVIYPALNCYNNKEMADRCTDKSAPKVIWSIKASAQFNSEVAYLFREGFQSSRIRLLLNEYDADKELMELKGYNKLSPAEQVMFKSPYIQTTLLIDELTNLRHDESMGRVRLYERPGMRKDRYSSASYNYWVALQIEQQQRKKFSSESRGDNLGFIKPPRMNTKGGLSFGGKKRKASRWSDN